MSDKTIKHFIFSRFFPKQDPKYPYDVLDVDFLSKQLVMANNMLRSLENQTNKDFELVFVLNDKFFDETKYEFIFSTLQDSTILPLKFIRRSDVSSLVQDAYDKYDFVIQSRLDFDDFLSKYAIADTQNKVNKCDNIIIYGYHKGYSYVLGELYTHGVAFFRRENGHWSALQSLIFESSFAKRLPFIYVYNKSHHILKLVLKDFLEKNGVQFEESMFQHSSMKAYIYVRHEFSQELLVTNSTLKLPNKKPLTTEDITKKQLEDEFGFFYDLNSIK